MRGAESFKIWTHFKLKEFRENVDRFFYNKFTILNFPLIEVLLAYLLLSLF